MNLRSIMLRDKKQVTKYNSFYTSAKACKAKHGQYNSYENEK